jgi:4-carboxymuconolactone decarboxylase
MYMKVSQSIALIFLAGLVGLSLGGRIHAQNPANGANTSATAPPLPKDVYPESHDRLPLLKRNDLDDYGKSVYDELSVLGGNPAPLRLYSPKLAKPMAEAHHYLKYESGLGERLTEIAVLTTARELDNQYEWTQWEIHARKTGDSRSVEGDVIDVIKYEKPVTGLAEKDAAVITYGRELFGQRKVSSETFAKVLHLFGPRGTVDLTELMALYSATGAELNAFDMQLQPGQKPMLPARGASANCLNR